MADNYLEKQMEDFRSGRIGRVRVKALGGKRAVVAGTDSPEKIAKALEMRRQGYRVAIIDADADLGRSLAYAHGIRFHHADPHNPEDLASEAGKLMEAWRGVDIIVGSKQECRIISEGARRWYGSLPIPREAALTLVIIN